MSRLHPATVVTIAACGWLLTLALNTPVASASVMLVALACGTVSTRNASVILTTIALSVPAALSMLVIHAPYGDTPVAPLLTADGLILAGSLSLRFCALMACFIAAMAALRIADIAKWLQVSRVGHKVAYVVGSSLQTLPQGAHAWRCVREANQLAGITITWRNTISRVIIPHPRNSTRPSPGRHRVRPGRETQLIAARCRFQVVPSLTLPYPASVPCGGDC